MTAPAEGPATVTLTLTDDEQKLGRPGDHYVSWTTVYEEQAVEQIVAARVAAEQARADEAERVIANIRALAYEDGFDVALRKRLRALLPAAPTEEDR